MLPGEWPGQCRISKVSSPIETCSPSSRKRSVLKLRTPVMPKRAALSTTWSSMKPSAWCGPSIGTVSGSRSSAAPPTWSIWPWVSQIFSTVTPVCLIAAKILSTSPPGSITTAFLVASHQMIVQFCSNSVTGTMIAPAFALVSVSCVMSRECRFLARRESERFRRWSRRPEAINLLCQPLWFFAARKPLQCQHFAHPLQLRLGTRPRRGPPARPRNRQARNRHSALADPDMRGGSPGRPEDVTVLSGFPESAKIDAHGIARAEAHPGAPNGPPSVGDGGCCRARYRAAFARARLFLHQRIVAAVRSARRSGGAERARRNLDRRDQVVGGGFARRSQMGRLSRPLRPAVLCLHAGSALRDLSERYRADRRRRLWRASSVRRARAPSARADAQADDGALCDRRGAANEPADRSAGTRGGLARRALGKDPLQGAAVHVEPPRRLGDVAIAHLIDALDMLPAHAVGRHRVLRRLGFHGAGRKQGGDDVVGIGGLCQIVDGPHLDRRHCGCDVAVAGQDDGARLGAFFLQRRHHVEPVAVAKPQIDHRESRRALADLRQPLGDAVTGGHGKAARLHRARKPFEERLVIFHDQKRAVGLFGEFGGSQGGEFLRKGQPSYGVLWAHCQ